MHARTGQNLYGPLTIVRRAIKTINVHFIIVSVANIKYDTILYQVHITISWISFDLYPLLIDHPTINETEIILPKRSDVIILIGLTPHTYRERIYRNEILGRSLVTTRPY